MDKEQELDRDDNSTEAFATEEARAEAGTEPPLAEEGLEPEEKPAPAPTAEELGRLLEDARAKADDHWNQLLRAKADRENLLKRHARELENAHKFALEGFVSDLLGVWDSLELGQSAALEEAADVAKLREGTELTLKLLRDVMSKFGVEQIDPQGAPFNPEYHQAMSMQPRADVPPNTVVNVVQKGYILNGRLVRPALVMVSQAVAGGIDEKA